MPAMVDIITKKRDGDPLSRAEIDFFISQYSAGEIPDYQAAALLMAIFFRGMTRAEIVNLTRAMAASGDQLDLSDIVDYAIDKHSSGGVGDKTTLVVLPLVASFGVPVAKMSGRGLGFSGGTLDKLEAITGFDVNLSQARFRQLAKDKGLVVAGQSASLAPADGLLYALRDVTGTVESLPLMASSIMSKKLASGANGIVLDVKLGHGAFMSTLDEARQLARIMVGIGIDAGRDTVALLSDMHQPLGVAVGNALEVAEALRTLAGGGPGDFKEHCIEVAAWMLHLAGRGECWHDLDATRGEVERKLESGTALPYFRDMAAAQGGDIRQIDDPGLLPKARLQHDILAREAGHVQLVRADAVGMATLALGAGRATKADSIDHSVGIEAFSKVGDPVNSGDVLMTIHANDQVRMDRALALLDDAVQVSAEPVNRLPLFYGALTASDV